MDPEADKIKLINRLIQNHLGHTNDKFNKQYKPLIEYYESKGYEVYRECMTENDIRGQGVSKKCWQLVTQFKFNVAYSKHSQQLMNCVDKVMEANDQLNERIKACTLKYEQGIQKQLKSQINRMEAVLKTL